MMAQRDRKSSTCQSSTTSQQQRSTNIYKMYLEAKLNMLEILHSNLHLRLEVQSVKEQFLQLLETFSEYEDKFIGDGCPVFAPSPIKNAERVSAARARVKTMYQARRISINARRLRMQGISPKKLSFSPSKGQRRHLDGQSKPRRSNGGNSTSSWETPAKKCSEITPTKTENFCLGNLSAIKPICDQSYIHQKPSPTWGPLHSTVIENPDMVNTVSKSRIRRPARSSSDGNVSNSTLITHGSSPISKTYSQSCCECNSVFRGCNNYTCISHQDRGPEPNDIFSEQCAMLDSMKYKIRDLEYQIFHKPVQGANTTGCSTCSTCSCDQYMDNKGNFLVNSLVQSTPCPVRGSNSRLRSDFGSFTDLSDISSCSFPKKRKIGERQNLSDSELYSNGSKSNQVSPIANQLSALDLSECLYPSMVETPSRKSFRVPSLLINFDQTADGLPSASLISRSPTESTTSNSSPSVTSPSSRLSSVISTPLYPSTAHATSDEGETNKAPKSSSTSDQEKSDQDKTIVCPASNRNSSDLDVTIRSNVVRFDVSPDITPPRLRRQVGQTKLDNDEPMREALGLTMSDLLQNSTTIAEVTSSAGNASLGATCASSPNFSELGSQSSDSSLGSMDITASIFPNQRRTRSNSSFKESDGMWSDSSLNVTVRAKSQNVTPAESQNNLLAPANSPNATNSSSSSRPTTDSNDRVDVMEFDYQKVRSQMPYRPRRHSSRPATLGKYASPRDDTNNNQVQKKFRMGPPPSRSSTFERQNLQNIPPSAMNYNRKPVTDGDSGFSTQNSQYANDRALAASHQSVYSEHTTTSSQATSTRTISRQRKKQVAKRMKQYNSIVQLNSRHKSESRSSLHSFGYV